MMKGAITSSWRILTCQITDCRGPQTSGESRFGKAHHGSGKRYGMDWRGIGSSGIVQNTSSWKSSCWRTSGRSVNRNVLKQLSTCSRTISLSKKSSSTRTFPWKRSLNCVIRKLRSLRNKLRSLYEAALGPIYETWTFSFVVEFSTIEKAPRRGALNMQVFANFRIYTSPRCHWSIRHKPDL